MNDENTNQQDKTEQVESSQTPGSPKRDIWVDSRGAVTRARAGARGAGRPADRYAGVLG